MKTHVRWFTGLMLCGAVSLLWPSSAQSEPPKLYGWMDAGGSLVQDTELKEYLDVPVSGNEVRFDPGFRLGIGMGCEFNRYLAAEFETGFTVNSVKSITGANYVDASLYQVPLLANLVFQYPMELRNRAKLVPLLGGGVGGTGVTLDMEYVSIGSRYSWGSAYDFVFAYQGFAGLRYEFNKNMALAVYYHYFVADAPTWEPDYVENTYGNMRMDALHTHSFSLRFDWRF